MSTNYHTPIPGPPAQPEATSELFNSRFSSLDSGISGKVDSTGNGSNITSEVSVAGTRRNLTSGGTLKVIFSEIQKWLSDMKAVAFSASYNDLINRPTTMMPTAHAATHKTGGSDALKAVDIGAVSEVLPGSNVTVSKNPDTGAVTINAAGGGSGGSAHIIANDGAALPNQGTLDFGVGLAAADDPVTFKTAVSLDMGAIQIGKAQISDFPSAMTPTAHAASHARGGSDVITPESIGAMNAEPIGIDLGKALPPNAGHGGFIDFHWNGSNDHTSRVISTSEDTITVEKNIIVTGNLYIAGNVGNANLLTDTGWIDMVLANGWTRIEGGLARFRKYLNIVFVVGQLYGGVATSPAFIQLPAGYRPHTRTEFACVRDDNTPVTGVVTHDGIMWLTTLSYGNTLCFSGSWLGEL